MNIKKIIIKEIKNSLKKKNIYKKYNYNIKNNTKYSDYQIYDFIKISKKENINIYKIINIFIKKIKKYKIFKKINIITPGIINIYIKKKEIEKIINIKSKIKDLGIKNKKKNKIIVDYSSPNISKEMHIGHLRSTVLGDYICNISNLLGDKVIKMNHIGDWGTNFGMIITLIKEKKININKCNIKKLEKIYKKSQYIFLKNKKFAKKCRLNTLKLQNNNKYNINIWKKITNITILENQKIYKKLNIKLNRKNIFGESFYKKKLKYIVKDLIKKKIALKDNKTIIVKNKKNNFNLIIKKKDGAFLYSTIDLACIKYRYEKYKINKIIYLIDIRQKEYMKNIFYIAKKAKYIPKKIKLIHYYFGNILNKNKKPFKTKKGNNIKLKKVIKKTINYVKTIINKKYKRKYNKQKIYRISKKVSIAAIKYMDLSKKRTKNYIFNIKKILSLKNNTGPYIQYSYIRIISLLKKNNTNITKCIKNNKFYIYNNLEFEISKKILNFEEIIKKSYKNGTSHEICKYLYNLSIKFSKIYELENITNIKNIKYKKSKLKLISIIGKIIRISLNILGIPILKIM